MSVLACDRKGCQNIMCDRLSDDYGYICNECFEELLESGPNTDVHYFMELGKKSKEEESDIDFAEKRYNSIFPIT